MFKFFLLKVTMRNIKHERVPKGKEKEKSSISLISNTHLSRNDFFCSLRVWGLITKKFREKDAIYENKRLQIRYCYYQIFQFQSLFFF